MLGAPPVQLLDGKYRVLALLGQGGTADVSLAALRGPSGFNKLVVLKSMKHALKAEPEFARMFMTEARLAARLNHPNIVQTNEVFEFEGLPVIVMEYLEGQALSSILARAAEGGGFSLAMHLRVLSDILSALHYAHDLCDYDGTPLGVVHRDVSPHNVFVTFDGQVKLLDFGIAKLAGSHGETATGVIKGKLRYMPPEQVAAEGVDRRSDIYSIGVMLWEAATGSKMWQGMSEATVMNRILSGSVPPLHEKNSRIQPELLTIIERALAPEREDRYSSAAELQLALDACIDTLEPLHRRDIGQAVAQLFADVRQATNKLVEEQLSKAASLSRAEYDKLTPLELTAFASVSAALGRARKAEQEQPDKLSRARRVLPAVLLAVLFLAAVGFGWQLLGRSEATSPYAGSSGRSAQQPASKRVSLRVTAFPATAKLYLQGALLPSNPVSRTFTREPERSVELLAEAEGYTSESRMIKFDQDWDIVLKLTPKPAAKPAVSTMPGKRLVQPAAARAAPSQLAPRSQPDCVPPYFFDERGIKKYKPRCL